MADNVTDEAKDVAEKGKEKLSRNGNGGGSDLAKKILLPAAAGVGTVAVTYAARKAPELVREQLLPKLEDRSSDEAAEIGKQTVDKMKDSGGVTGKVLGAASKLGGGGDDDGGGGKKTRRLPIQRWTDVAVPVEKAYEAWTDFEKYPQYMHRVLSVEKQGTNRVKWREKIWFSTREWEGQITDRRKNDRIAWKTRSGTQHTGVVSFHKLSDNLTRVMITMNFEPAGMMEKMASGLRFAKRAVQADLARFKAYVELKDAKGLEYSSTKDDDKKDDDKKKDDEQNENGDDASRAESNGSSGSDEEAEEARQQRAERRESRKT